MGKEIREWLKSTTGVLKNQRFVRVVARPFVDRRRRNLHERYLQTADCQYLKTLRNIHRGQRCFILGNGPSLKAADCDKLIGEVTFAANKIYTIFEQTAWRPTYYLSIDKDFLARDAAELESYDLGHMFIASYCGHRFSGPLDRVTHIYCSGLGFDVDLKEWNDRSTYISEDISNHVCAGHTVTFYAIQMAIYMGFSDIYLLGVDNNYSVWIDENGRICRDDSIKDYFDKRSASCGAVFAPASLNYAYKAARTYCDTHGITIRNATRGGKLEVFERVDFDELFAGKVEAKLNEYLWRDDCSDAFRKPQKTFHNKEK